MMWTINFIFDENGPNELHLCWSFYGDPVTDYYKIANEMSTALNRTRIRIKEIRQMSQDYDPRMIPSQKFIEDVLGINLDQKPLQSEDDEEWGTGKYKEKEQ